MEVQFFQEPNTFVGHVELKVQNLEASIKFYKEVLGFQILEQSERRASLTANGKRPLLTIEQPQPAGPKEANRSGLYHFAILLPNRLELAKILKHFAEQNQQLGASDHLVSEALYLNDPDGNGIEIYTDRESSTWNWQNNEVIMTVDPLDAEDILAELEGESWGGMPEGTVMGHIHLHVSELQKTEEFYNKGLGFDVVCRFGKQALFMSTGNYHHHIGLNTWAGVGAPASSEQSAGLKVFSLVFSSEEARQEVIEQVQRLGYEVKNEDGSFVTKDPSGNLIKLTV
ncbi:VOC family protein [Halobacillus naozhouensis]|uniref:VOC family protein n=1 Tax=Halobacillus naozhouensis TaxID=554880 RepID=A0ABY8J0V7_9BACI|nr:VOC family protein [Halobacillus naozhouensis]WFT75038.1 VOC family protein [Halobacillus naozhouensis]